MLMYGLVSAALLEAAQLANLQHLHCARHCWISDALLDQWCFYFFPPLLLVFSVLNHAERRSSQSARSEGHLCWSPGGAGAHYRVEQCSTARNRCCPFLFFTHHVATSNRASRPIARADVSSNSRNSSNLQSLKLQFRQIFWKKSKYLGFINQPKLKSVADKKS